MHARAHGSAVVFLLLCAAAVSVAGCPSLTAGDRPDPGTPPSQQPERQQVPDVARPAEKAEPLHGIDPDRAPPLAPAKQDEVSVRHVLIQYKGAMRAPDTVSRSKAEAQTLAATVQKEASTRGNDFAAIASKYSDEPGAKERGGDLGSFPRGVMVGEFESAAFSLGVGSVSGVIETPFGFHVIQRYK